MADQGAEVNNTELVNALPAKIDENIDVPIPKVDNAPEVIAVGKRRHQDYLAAQRNHADSTQNLKQHPLSKAFPALQAEQATELAADIKANGLHNPIVLYQGKVLDGWHRYTACMIAGVLPNTLTYDGDNPVAFVISQNIQRRHLSLTQKVELAKKLLKEETKKAAARMRTGGKKHTRVAPKGATPGKATEKVAKAVGVSTRTVERAVAIDKKASPEIKKKVAAGKMSFSAAEKAMRSDEQKILAKMSGKAKCKIDVREVVDAEILEPRTKQNIQPQDLDEALGIMAASIEYLTNRLGLKFNSPIGAKLASAYLPQVQVASERLSQIVEFLKRCIEGPTP